MKIKALIFVFLLFTSAVFAQNLVYDKAIYTEDYGLSFFPQYPPKIGETVTLRLKTFVPTNKVTLYSDREEKIPMKYSAGYWWGEFKIPDDYQAGGHFFTVWARYIGFKPEWKKSKVWYKALNKTNEPIILIEFPPLYTFEVQEYFPLPVTGEAVEFKILSPEASPLLIKGSQSITFKTRSLEGSKEGYSSGTQQTREESLRVNISGSVEGTEIDATIYRSTSTGIDNVAAPEEEISILMKRGSTEVFLGDFNAELTDAEFSRLEKVLSGGRVKGEYGKWGFTALYSSPKGESKTLRTYGDGTQGPYSTDFSPVVIDSDQVYLNGALQKRGDDYTIDYQAGTITFINSVVDDKSIIQINYDYRQTAYHHATYGLRGELRPTPSFKLGATYLDDSDSLSGAADIRQSMSQEVFNPQSHRVFGVDAKLVSENIAADAEVAYSLKDLNLLAQGVSEESGGAAKFNLSSSLGPFGVTARVKRIAPKFQAIADPDPKQDVLEYFGGLSYRPGSLFGSQINYDYQKYSQGGVVYNNLYKDTKIQLTPEKLPSLEYIFSENDESNDPVTGSSIRRVITKNSVETIHQAGFFSSSIKGTKEHWLKRSPSDEVTDYDRLNLGLATIGLEKMSFTSNVELENRKVPDGTKPFRRTYNLNLSAIPSKSLFASSSFQIIDDSIEGQTNVTDLAYRAQPSKVIKTEGKYTITSLLDEFPTTSEAVSKQSGSFSFDLRPHRQIRLRYLYKPNFTMISRTQTLSYRSDQQQAEINLIPQKQVMLGMIYKLGNSSSIYLNDYPNYNVDEKNEATDSVLYTLKVAPLQILSTEFNYLKENARNNTLAATQEPYTYTKGRRRGDKFDAIVKTSLSELFSIDSRYTFEKQDQGSGEASSDVVDTKTHTGMLKGIWNLSDFWTFSLSGAFSRKTDYLLSQVTYTVSPGIGFIYRIGNRLRVDFDYLYSNSYAGAINELHDYTLKTRYGLSDFVSLNFQAEQEVSYSPDYRLTDITMNVEINL
jgi:hypothetical protein